MREQWINDYSLGIEELDKQHRQILELYKCLYRSVMRKNPEVFPITIILSEMISVTEHHFATEEQYFKFYNDPEMIDWHKSEHEISISLLRTFERELEDGIQTAKDTFSLISYWILGHFCGVDQTLKEVVPQLSAVKV